MLEINDSNPQADPGLVFQAWYSYILTIEIRLEVVTQDRMDITGTGLGPNSLARAKCGARTT